MMDFFKQNKITVGGGAALALLIVVYFMFFSGGGTSATLTSTGGPSPVSTDLLVTLQNLHTIKLDNSIFTNPVFVSLSDFGVTIPPENVGRRNPFLPLTGTPAAGSSGLKLPAGTP